jgi:hypothetical protein
MSAGIASLIAHVSFWVLLAYGWFWEEIGWTGTAVFVALWIAGLFGVRLLPYGDGLFPSYVALLDVALVLIIFKGDVSIR